MINRIAVNTDVVEIDKETFLVQILKDEVHDALESHRGINKTERRNGEFIKAIRSSKGVYFEDSASIQMFQYPTRESKAQKTLLFLIKLRRYLSSFATLSNLR